MIRRMAGMVLLGLVLCHAPISNGAEAAKKKLLVIGGNFDGHPPTTHEFMAGVKIIDALLKQFPEIEVTTANGDGDWPEGPDLIRKSDGVVLFLCEGAKWIDAQERRQIAMADLIERGGGFAALHWAVGAKDPQYVEPFVQWLGACHGGNDRKYTKIETDVVPGNHPVMAGIEPFRIHDEWYYKLKIAKPESSVTPLLSAKIDGELYPVAWAYERADGGRSFGFVGLHFHRNWKAPQYRTMVTRGIVWSLGLPVPTDGVNIDLPEEIYDLPKQEAKPQKKALREK